MSPRDKLKFEKIIVASAVLLALTNISCSVLKTIANISRLQFKLGVVSSVEVNGIPVEGKKSINDFSPVELIKLTGAVANGHLPLSFILNVEVKNPNDGTGGYPRTDIGLSSFPWKLYIDDKETISGNINNTVNVPGVGEATNIPLRINIDLFRFFGNQGYKSLINLVFAIAGSRGYSSRLALYAQPTISTMIGNIIYPSEIKIVSQEFSN